MSLQKLIGFLHQHEKQTGLLVDQARLDFDRNHLEIERLEQLRIDEEKRMREARQSETAWDSANKAIQYMGSALSIPLGAAAILSGAAVLSGTALVCSGILGLANRAIADLGGYKALAAWITHSREQQKKIAERLDTGGTFLTLGMSLGAGWGLRAFLNSKSVEAVAKIVQIATQTLGGVTQVGVAKARQRTENISKDLALDTTAKTIFSQHQIEVSQKLGELVDPRIERILTQAIQGA